MGIALDYIHTLTSGSWETEEEALHVVIVSHCWIRVSLREIDEGKISEEEWQNKWKKQTDFTKRKDITVIEYFKFIGKEFEGDEESAIKLLIKEHHELRDRKVKILEEWKNSPEGKAWAEEVEKMSFEDCIEFITNCQDEHC